MYFVFVWFKQKGASVAEMIAVLGKTEAVHRLNAAQQMAMYTDSCRR